MPGGAGQPGEVLDGYGKFLREKNLAPAKHQPYLVRRVRESLLFAGANRGYTFERTLDLFLAEAGGRVGLKPWQIQQAADAVRIYRYQYRGARKGDGADGKPQPFRDEATMLERLRGVIRLRHYAKSTENTHLHWTRRFPACRRGAGCRSEPTADDARAFLTRLAMVEPVSASTQDQAFTEGPDSPNPPAGGCVVLSDGVARVPCSRLRDHAFPALEHGHTSVAMAPGFCRHRPAAGVAADRL